MTRHVKPEIEEAELDVLVQAILVRHGYDFRHYARASLRRRILDVVAKTGVGTISDLVPLVMHDEKTFDGLLTAMSVTVTEMFRDPHFYRDFREQVVPVLRTYPFRKIWHAGCATGEEVYSMAILLHEEDLLGGTQLYGTDFNGAALTIAKRGIYRVEDMKEQEENYLAAGGTASLADYYRNQYRSAKMAPFLTRQITFADHNLVTDSSFGEVHVVVCRNVLIYFDATLKNRVLTLLKNSLVHRGFLCLGDKETLEFSAVGADFETVSTRAKIYRARLPVPSIFETAVPR